MFVDLSLGLSLRVLSYSNAALWPVATRSIKFDGSFNNIKLSPLLHKHIHILCANP